MASDGGPESTSVRLEMTLQTGQRIYKKTGTVSLEYAVKRTPRRTRRTPGR